MSVAEIAVQLAELIRQSDELDDQIALLEQRMSNEMLLENLPRYEHAGYIFNKIAARAERRVNMREFYEIACQHPDIPAAALAEITEQSLRDRTVSAHLSIRRPRGGG